MVAVFILVSMFVGVASAVTALFMGSSLLGAFGWYVASGSVAMVAMPAIALLASLAASRGQEKATAATAEQRDSTSQAQAETTVTEDAPETMRILAVDDDPFVLEIVPKIAANAGFPTVTTVASGAEALTALNTPGVTFDCLLLDIKMPELDGIELCRRVRSLSAYQETPIIMLTAMRDLESMSDAYQAGATDYATKPFEIDEMGKRLQLAHEGNVLRQQRAGQGRTAVASAPATRAGKKPKGNGLVSEATFSSYLQQLTDKQAEQVHVYALSLTTPSAVPLDDIASATARCIGASHLLMANAEDQHLLFAVDAEHQAQADHIEAEIKRQLTAVNAHRTDTAENEPAFAWGGPVPLAGSREARGRMAIDRAIVQAVSRQTGTRDRRSVG